MADKRQPTFLNFPPSGSIALEEALARYERRQKLVGRLLLLVGVPLVALAVLVGGVKVAGAQDWYLQPDAVSILNPTYVPTIDPVTGQPHGDSIHAVCDGPGFIEVGVHPFDEVARSLQVFSADGALLLNLFSADQTELVPLADNPRTLRYSGGEPYSLMVDLCTNPEPEPVPPTTPEVTVPPTTAPPVDTTPSTVAETTTTVDYGCTWDPEVSRYRDSATGQFCSGEMTTTVPADVTGVTLGTPQRAVLPTTGSGLPLGQLSLAAFVLILAGTVAKVGRRAIL